MASHRRRRIAASSSDEEVPAVQQLAKGLEPLQTPGVQSQTFTHAAQAPLTQQTAEHPEPLHSLPVQSQASKANNARKRQASRHPDDLSLDDTPGPLHDVPSASSEPGGPQKATENARSDASKVKQAARQFLKAHRDEERMSNRLAALGSLSPDEAQRFYMSNKDRRKGGWVWDVLDAFSGNSTSSPIQSAPNAGSLVAKPDTAGSSDSPVSTAVAPCPAQAALSSTSKHFQLASPNNDDPDVAKSEEAQAVLVRPAEPAALAAPMAPPLESAATAVARARTTRHGQAGREGRSFAPLLSSRRGASGATLAPAVQRWVATAKTQQATPLPQPKVSAQLCRHQNQSTPRGANSHCVCTDCGELLFYDGWRFERVAPDERAPKYKEMQGQAVQAWQYEAAANDLA